MRRVWFFTLYWLLEILLTAETVTIGRVRINRFEDWRTR